MARGRAITVLTLGLAILVAVAVAWAGKAWLLERWFVFRLHSTDPVARVGAIKALGQWAREGTIFEILAVASEIEGDQDLHQATIASLASMGSKAVPNLLEALNATSKKSRWLAARALLAGQQGGERPIPLLLWLLAEGEREERVQAIEELGNRESLPTPAVEAIASNLDSQNNKTNLTDQAEAALSRLGPAAASAAPAFVNYVLKVKHIRAEAALTRFGAPAVGPLMEALGDPEDDHRWRAIRLLGMIGPASAPAVPAIVERLKDRRSSLRDEALEALSEIGPHAVEALPALAEELHHAEASTASRVSLTLGNIGPAALPVLLDALESDDHRVRILAADALEITGTAAYDAIPALDRTLNDEDGEVRLAAAAALLRIEGSTERVARAFRDNLATLPRLWLEWRWSGRLLEATSGLEGCDTQLAQFLCGTDDDREWVLRLLSRLEKPVPGLKEVARVLGCQIEEEPLDPPALEALWKVARAPEAVKALLRILEQRESSTMRKAAFECLATLGPDASAAIPELTRLLTELKPRGLMTSENESLFVKEADGAIWIHDVIRTLGAIGPAAAPAVPVLRELLQNGKLHLRASIAHALQRIGDDSRLLVPVLCEILVNPQCWREPSEFSRSPLSGADGEGAALVLGNIGPAASEALPVLRAALEAESDAVRYRVAWAIWRISAEAETILPTLLSMMERSDNVWGTFRLNAPRVSSVLLSSLLAEIGPAAAPRLLRLLRHQDYRVRLAAVRSLGSPVSARSFGVVQALADAIRDDHFRVAEAAVEALAKCSLDSKGIEVLRPVLFSENSIEIERAARVLAGQREPGLPLLLERLEAVSGELPEGFFLAFRKLGAAAVQVLAARARSGEAPTVMRALHALRAMGSAASESSGDLEALMAGNDPEIRLEAAHCLAITTENVDRAMAVATQCLMDQSFLRIPAAGVLADMARGNPSALRLLSEMLRENEVQVVIAAAGALAQMQVADQTAVGTLIDRLADPDPRVRRACVEALGALGAQASQAMQGLLTLIHDADPDVRRAVTRALGNVGAGDEEAVRALADSLGDEEVAPMAALALAKCGDAARAAVPQLIAALEDPDVRIEAIRALATLGPRASTAVPALFKILLAPGSILPSTYTVEEEVVRCLEQMGPVIRPQLLREIDRYAESSEPIPRTLCQLVEAVGPFVADAIPVLVKCLSCTDYDDRVNTVRALGAMGPVAQKVTSRLREMLGNPGEHPDVILALRKALRRISPTE